MVPTMAVHVARHVPTGDAAAWTCFAYTAVVSMFLGFFAWYRGLALGGVAKVSQIQLLQPLLTVTESIVLFGQHLDPWVLVTALAVLTCVTAAQRSRVTTRPHGPPEPFPAATRSNRFS